MRVLRDEQQFCPCYEECQEFQKLVELKDSGLVIYCHRPRKEDIRQAEPVESAVNTSRDVFILYNKKDVKIRSSELTPELEKKNISCPRCRKTFEHARKLMLEVKSIDRKIVMGICDHCHEKAKTTAKTIKKPLCACDEIVKKFISVKGEQKEDIKKYVKIWLSKMGHLLKDDIMLNRPKQIKTRAYSELQINRGLNSPGSIHEPEIQQIFYSGMHKSDIYLNTKMRETNLKEGHMKQAVAFFQPIEQVETAFAHTPHESEKINTMIPRTSLEDSDTTFVETYAKELPKTSLKDRKQEEVFEDGPSIDFKEALKIRHDLSLRQMMSLEKNSGVPYFVSKRPDIYETPKFTPWTQKEPTSKYHVESETNIKIPTKTKHDPGRCGTRDLDYVSDRDVKFSSSRPLQDSYYEPRKADEYHHDKIKQGLYDSEEGPKKIKKLEDCYIMNEELKLQRSVDKISHKAKKSDQHVAKSKRCRKKALEPEESAGFVLKPQFSFFFPSVIEKEQNQVKVDVSSSYLIKDTQEKIRIQVEKGMRRLEEERQQKHEQAQKKKLAQEEKTLQAEEIKKQAIEVKKFAEDQKRQQDTAERDGGVFSESDQKGKISKDSRVAKKGTKTKPEQGEKILQKAKKVFKSKPEQEDKIDEVLQKAKNVLKSKPEQGDKIDEVLQKAKKVLKFKPEEGDRIDEVLQKAKKVLKSKPEGDKIDEVLQKAKNVLKSKSGQGDKIDEVLQKAKKVLKSKHEGDKIDELLQKTKNKSKSKPEQGDKIDEILQKAKKNSKSKPEQRDKIDVVLQKATKDLKSKPEEEAKIAELLDIIKKDLKSTPEKRDKIDEVLEKTKKYVTGKSELKEKGDDEVRDKEKKDLKEKPTQKSKDDDLISMVMKDHKKKPKIKDTDDDLISMVMKDQKKKPKTRDTDDETIEKGKKGLKGKLVSIEKGNKDLKSGEEQKDKISVSEKPKKDFKAKSEQNDKSGEKKQKTKTGKEEQDKKLQREKEYKERLEQVEPLRKEKEALRQQAAKERGELSKEKKKRNSSEEIKMSLSKIQKSTNMGGKEESANKQEIFVIKQEKKKESKKTVQLHPQKKKLN